jgi:hypothetical protein
VGNPPDIVVAFGTATIPDQASYNGSVAIGNKVFVNNPYSASPNPDSNWMHVGFGKVLEEADPSISRRVLSSLDREHRAFIESRFLLPPLNPARPPVLLPSTLSVALSNVNVTNPDDYVWADLQPIQAFAKVAPNNSIGSVETTHGVIKLAVPSPHFLFVSGIANRAGYFNLEVAPRVYAQNFVAAHNAGIGMAAIIAALME